MTFSRAQTTIIQRRDDSCNGYYADIDKTINQFEFVRSHRDNIFSDNYKEVFNYYVEDDKKELFNAFLPWAILLLILMGFCFVTTIVLIVLAFGKYKNEENKTGIYTAFGCILFWAFLGLFAAIVVFIGKSQYKYNRVFCTVYDIPATIMSGVNNDQEKFLGLENVQIMLKDFQTSLPQMSNLSTSFNRIFSTNAPSKTSSAWSNLINFVSTYESTTIQNGTGSISTPNTIAVLTTSVSEEIGTEFSNLDMVAQKLQLAAEEGRRYQTASYRNTVSTTLATADTKLSTIITELNNMFDPLIEHVNKAMDYSVIGYWVLFGLGCAAIVLAFIILTVLCCVCTWQRCHKGLVPARILLVILGIVACGLAVITFIIMVGSVSNSSFCGFIGEINRGNFDVFKEIDQEVSDDVVNLFKSCTQLTEDGYLGDVLFTTNTEKEAYNSVNTFLDGLLAYNYYENNLKSAEGSTQIDNQVSTWEQYLNGTAYDFKTVETNLKSLNDLNNCADTSFALTSTACTANNTANCVSIQDTDSYTPASCVEDATTASQLFIDLKSHITEETALMTSMINDLSDTNLTTPNSKYIEAKTTLDNLSTDYVAISTVVSAYLAVTTNYNTKQLELVDCRALRRSLYNFESESCFGFNYFLYIILVLAAICAVLAFFLLWCLCCGLRENGTYEETSVIEDPYMDKQVIKEAGDVLDFEEREIIPNY